MERVILASASPRRAELLRAAGIEFDVMPANADETVHAGETTESYVRRVAEAKARAVMAAAAGRPVVAADTVVVVDDVILGKPAGREDAKRMLRLLSGRAHEVLTAVSLSRGPEPPSPPGGFGGPGGSAPHLVTGSAPHVDTRIELTTVEFAVLSERDIDWYVDTGEPYDKAGAYAIQGYASRFIMRIAGSYSNVVGLPVSTLFQMFKEAGFQP
jgi:septum formation protein